jgi:hypothetical protein
MVKDYNANNSPNGRPINNHAHKGGSGVTVGMSGTPAVALVRHQNPANARVSQVESEDEMSDPRTPTSVSSQGSQGYDSAGSDFVDIEGFTAIPDTSLPELNLQVRQVTFCEMRPFESRYVLSREIAKNAVH